MHVLQVRHGPNTMHFMPVCTYIGNYFQVMRDRVHELLNSSEWGKVASFGIPRYLSDAMPIHQTTAEPQSLKDGGSMANTCCKHIHCSRLMLHLLLESCLLIHKPLHQKPGCLQALGENVILIRSLLDAVGCCARVLGPPFASEGTPLRVILLPLLERLGDPCPSVATTADDAITSICLHCNYPGKSHLSQHIISRCKVICLEYVTHHSATSNSGLPLRSSHRCKIYSVCNTAQTFPQPPSIPCRKQIEVHTLSLSMIFPYPSRSLWSPLSKLV